MRNSVVVMANVEKIKLLTEVDWVIIGNLLAEASKCVNPSAARLYGETWNKFQSTVPVILNSATDEEIITAFSQFAPCDLDRMRCLVWNATASASPTGKVTLNGIRAKIVKLQPLVENF